MWVKKIALSRMVFKIQAFLCFVIFAKNSKIQNGCQFWQEKHFLTIGLTTLQRYPIGKNFCRNSSTLQNFQDTSIFVFCNFCEKFENSKWPPYLVRQNFLKIGFTTLQIPYGSKILSKSLYLTRFSRYKHFCVLQFLRKIRKFFAV